MTERRPQIDPADFALLSRKWWRATTRYPSRYLLLPGFFDLVVRSLAVDDRIDILAEGDKPGTHAVLVVDSIGPDEGDRVKVSVLQEFKRP